MLARTNLNSLLQNFTNNPYNIGSLAGAELRSVADVQILDFGGDSSGGAFPVLTILGTLNNQNASGSYPSTCTWPDTNTAGTLNGGPATMMMQIWPGQGLTPVLIEVDVLSAHSN